MRELYLAAPRIGFGRIDDGWVACMYVLCPVRGESPSVWPIAGRMQPHGTTSLQLQYGGLDCRNYGVPFADELSVRYKWN